MRICRYVIRATLGVVLLASCGRGGPPPPPPPPPPVPPPVRLYYDNGGGIRDSMRVVMRERQSLERRWREATSPQASPPATPTIDFDREMVLLVTAGRMTPEEEIHVDSMVVKRELNPQNQQVEVLTVYVRTVVGCGRFRTDAYPLEIVRVRRFDGLVRWAEQIQQKNCGDVPVDGS